MLPESALRFGVISKETHKLYWVCDVLQPVSLLPTHRPRADTASFFPSLKQMLSRSLGHAPTAALATTQDTSARLLGRALFASSHPSAERLGCDVGLSILDGVRASRLSSERASLAGLRTLQHVSQTERLVLAAGLRQARATKRFSGRRHVELASHAACFVRCT